MRVWQVKKRRQLKDFRGNVIGNPGDTFEESNEYAMASPSDVRLIVVEDEPEPEEIEEAHEPNPNSLFLGDEE